MADLIQALFQLLPVEIAPHTGKLEGTSWRARVKSSIGALLLSEVAHDLLAMFLAKHAD
jgi:hypothetical protein